MKKYKTPANKRLLKIKIRKENMKTFYVHCGNYRTFEVDAKDEKQAIRRFEKVKPAGFTKEYIMGIELKVKK